MELFLVETAVPPLHPKFQVAKIMLIQRRVAHAGRFQAKNPRRSLTLDMDYLEYKVYVLKYGDKHIENGYVFFSLYVCFVIFGDLLVYF